MEDQDYWLGIVLNGSKKQGEEERAAEYREAIDKVFEIVKETVIRPLAHRYAQQRAGRQIQEDLVHEGYEAFLAHIHEYDPARGTFANFMRARIRWRMWSYLNNDKGIPDRIARQQNLVQRAAGELAQELGHEPTVDEIATRAGIAPRRVHLPLRATESLDGPDAPPVPDPADTPEEMEIRAEERREAEVVVTALRAELAQLEADHPAWVNRFATAGRVGGIRYLVLSALLDAKMNSFQMGRALSNPADPDLTERWPAIARTGHLAPYVPTTWAETCSLFKQPVTSGALRKIRERGRRIDHFTPFDPDAWAMICHRFPQPHTTADVRRILREEVPRYLEEQRYEVDAAM